jgi:hypothetical protein
LLHVQEHRYNTTELGEMVRATGLEFLGFEFADPRARAAYCQRFPQDTAATSLENWGQFEDEHPEVFSGMYQFWVVKPAA